MTSKAEVFLSSNIKEFKDCRKILAKKISAKPLLNCMPLEDQGPKSDTTLEASLAGVRKSDIVVVMIGEKDSEITRKEIEETIRELKYCLVYVKKTKNRDPIMDKFIETTIKSEFKYELFKTKIELYSKILQNLEDHILDILTMGLEAYKKKRKEAKNTWREVHEETRKLIDSKKSDLVDLLLRNAEDSLSQGDTFTSVVKSSTAMEVVIQNILKSHGYDEKEMKKPMGWIVGRLQSIGLLDQLTTNKIMLVWAIRSQVLHGGKNITKEQADSTINIAKDIAARMIREKNVVRILKGPMTRRGGGYFEPKSLFVKIGEKVKWINVDSVEHTVTSGTPIQEQTGTVFDSSVINPGKTFEFIFTKNGVWRYFDQIYPWMEGKVIVE